jgi:DNA-binding MarR family transcriptional regulator
VVRGTLRGMADAAREPGRAGEARDLVEGLTSAWRREMPEIDRIDAEMTRRAARLGVILQDRLQDCLMPWGLTRADFSVLNVLRSIGQPYELRPTDLSARLLLSSGGVSNVLNRLAKTGLIERERDSRDGRGTWVRLTPRGVEVAEATMRAWVADQETLYRNVTPQMARAAADALRDVLLAIGDVEPTAPSARRHPVNA